MLLVVGTHLVVHWLVWTIALSGHTRCLVLLALFLTFLLLQFFNQSVNLLQHLRGVHLRQCLQAVLQFHCLCVWLQFFEYLGFFVNLLIVVTILVEQPQHSRITFLRLHKFLSVPIELTQVQPHHTFLHTVACALLHAVLVGIERMKRVTLSQIDVAHGIIYLVQVFCILAVAGHRLQLANHLLALSLRHHLGLLNPCIEFQLVRGIALEHLLEFLERQLVLSCFTIQLSKQEMESCLFHAMTLLHGQLDIRDGLFIQSLAQLIVSHHRCTQGIEIRRKTVSPRLVHQSFSIIEPIQLSIALGFRQSGTSNEIGFGEIKTLDIGKGRSGFHIFALPELCLTHQEPSPPQERIVFLLAQPNLVLWCFRFRALPVRTRRNGMLLDGFLAFLHSSVELPLTQRNCFRVSRHIERNHLHIVILIPRFLCLHTLLISLMSIEVSIIASLERLHTTSHSRILLCRTRNHQAHHDQAHQQCQYFLHQKSESNDCHSII